MQCSNIPIFAPYTINPQKHTIMKTGRFYSALILLATVWLSGITEAVAQTYKKSFVFEFSKESFSIKKSDDGWDYIQPDTLLYDCTFESDTSKPELPHINYKILLPDNYKVKEISHFLSYTFYYKNITLRPNTSKVSTSTTNGKSDNAAYPFAIHSEEATCTSEEIVDGYRIANISIMPFRYYVEEKILETPMTFELRVIIEPVDDDEKCEHKGDLPESIKSQIYNTEDIDNGVGNWAMIKSTATPCTVGDIAVFGLYKIEQKYTKDWNIRFAAPHTLTEKVQAGILVNTDSIHNGTTYQVIERKVNGNVTDSLLYRQEGDKVYRYSETEKKDILLFDFGLNAGDEFVTSNGEVWTVDKIEEKAQFNDWTEKTITLKGKDDGEVKDVWLEHVGSLHTGILTYNDLGGSGSLPQLVYCRQGDYTTTYPWLFDVNTEHFKIVYFNPFSFEEIEGYNFIQSLSPEEAAYFEQYEGDHDYLYAEFEGDTLHVYGKMGVECYPYSMECRITGNEILLKVNDIHYGMTFECSKGRFVDIRIPGIKAGDYTIKYAPFYSEYTGEELILTAPPSAIESTPSVERTGYISVNGSTITCTSPTATKLEIYTMDAVKVGEAAFASGEATVKVSKIPATYLYIVTYPNGKRESGKVTVKN